jgi:hypothetical protein
MSRRSNREGQELTVSWLTETSVEERSLLARVEPLAKVPSRPKVPGPQQKRWELLHWATEHCYPQMVVRLRNGRRQLIAPGASSWRAVCRTSVIEIVEAALEQSVTFRLPQEDLVAHEEALRAWGKSHDFPELLYCCAGGEQGMIAAGEEAWEMFLDGGKDVLRALMAAEAWDLDVTDGREE